MKIKTKNGIISFEEVHFEQNSGKKIDLEISKENLLDFQKVLDKHEVKFGLIYGTLLGAIRENNFIKHDEDIDVYILEEDRNIFLDSLHDLESIGFVVGRYIDGLLSILRNGEYIDIYIFKKRYIASRICNGTVIKEKYLTDTMQYDFLGSSFRISRDYEKLLVSLYGEDWKIPKQNAPANAPTMITKIIKKKKKETPYIYDILRKIKFLVLSKMK